LAKFDRQIDLDVLKCDTSPKLKPKVDLRRSCRHLGDRRDVTTPSYHLIRIKFVGRSRFTCRWWQ